MLDHLWLFQGGKALLFPKRLDHRVKFSVVELADDVFK
jgi:hypothetical protein